MTMVSTNGNIFFKFQSDRNFTNDFEIFLKLFEVLKGSAKDDFYTDYFETVFGYKRREGLTLKRGIYKLLLTKYIFTSRALNIYVIRTINNFDLHTYENLYFEF